MLHRHISTVAQNRQTKHWLWRGPFAFFVNFLGTEGSPTCLRVGGGGHYILHTAPLNPILYYH